MARFVLTSSNSYATALEWSKRPGYQIITPSRLAARALHAQHQALRRLAIEALESGGKKIAPDRTAQRLFRQVVQELRSRWMGWVRRGPGCWGCDRSSKAAQTFLRPQTPLPAPPSCSKLPGLIKLPYLSKVSSMGRIFTGTLLRARFPLSW